MEEKYEKIAKDLGLKNEGDYDDLCCPYEEDYFSRKKDEQIQNLKLQVQILTKLLIEYKQKLDDSQEQYEELKNNREEASKKIAYLNNEIENLEKIIDKLIEIRENS